MGHYFSKNLINRRVYKLALSVFFAICLLILSAFVYQLYCVMYRPMTTDTSSQPLLITLHPNESATSLAHSLRQLNLIQSERFFLWFIRIHGLSAQLKAGMYVVNPNDTPRAFLYRVISGDVLTQLFLIKPGVTYHQVNQDLIKAPYLTNQSSAWLGFGRQHTNPEGLLLADSYQYQAGFAAQTIVSVAHNKLEAYLSNAWQQRDADLPYHDAYELLIAASILEKETSLLTEKQLISGIIVNRLKRHMPLQMDPTVIYALQKDYQGSLKHSDLLIDSRYNTYRYRGLPPTPIAMVSRESIDAAAHPIMTDYLYFVARKDGKHEFSKTYDEQKKAIRRYLKG